jgi:hypothetical protein
MARTLLRLDALIRVSEVGGRGAHLRSPAMQRAQCQQAADDLATDDLDVVIVNPDAPPAIDVSGGTMDRADIRALRERLDAGLTDGVVMACADRFSRAPIEEPMTLFRSITSAGGHFVVADLGLDIKPDDPNGEPRLVGALQASRNQYVARRTQWANSRRDAVKENKSLGVPPFGYQHADPTPRANARGIEDSRLVPDDRLAPVVLALFERKAAGGTWLELARWLDTAAPKPDGRLWARASVQHIIKNRVYLGESHHGATTQPRAHTALITSPSLWRRAQNPAGHRTARGTYLLTGLVICAYCGRRMEGAHGARPTAASTGDAVSAAIAEWSSPGVYRCVTRGCRHRATIAAHLIEHEVVRQLAGQLDESVDLDSVDSTDEDTAAVRAEIERLTDEIRARALLPVQTHPVAIAAYAEALAADVGALEAEEDRLRDVLDRQRASESDFTLPEFGDLTLTERRETVQAGIESVRVRPATARGPRSRAADRIAVTFKDSMTLRVSEAWARILRDRTAQDWVVRPA